MDFALPPRVRIKANNSGHPLPAPLRTKELPNSIPDVQLAAINSALSASLPVKKKLFTVSERGRVCASDTQTHVYLKSAPLKVGSGGGFPKRKRRLSPRVNNNGP